MNFTDFAIIYLALGSPFAAYYFFQNRKDSNQFGLFFNTVFTLTVWFPYALKLWQSSVKRKLNSSKFKLKNSVAQSAQENAETYERFFTDFLFAHEINIGVYDFREVFERYVGLTLAICQSRNSNINTESETEFYKATNSPNVNLSARCLHRRNVRLLENHQKSASDDLILLFAEMRDSVSDKSLLMAKIEDFLSSVGDKETRLKFSQRISTDYQARRESQIKLIDKRLAHAN